MIGIEDVRRNFSQMFIGWNFEILGNVNRSMGLVIT